MSLTTHIVNFFFSHRRREIDFFREHPAEVQELQLKYLLEKGTQTSFGKERSMQNIHSIEQFQQQEFLFLCDSL